MNRTNRKIDIACRKLTFRFNPQNRIKQTSHRIFFPCETLCLLCVFVFNLFSSVAAEAEIKKVILIAGKKSHAPGFHEYEKGVKLLKACLDASPDAKGIKTEIYLNGWPDDPKVLEDAATILMYCDGADHNEDDHPLLRGDHLATMDQLMKRGVGFVALHYTIIAPNKRGGPQFLDWIGGYFDYQSGPAANGWFSKIATHTTKPLPATPSHPICRGLAPFDLNEEYYYNLRFLESDPRRVPILKTAIPGEPEPQVVAWAVERKDGGRGFGFSGGHFHSNWSVENYRKMILNAILWTAHVEIPVNGVESKMPPE